MSRFLDCFASLATTIGRSPTSRRILKVQRRQGFPASGVMTRRGRTTGPEPLSDDEPGRPRRPDRMAAGGAWKRWR